MKKSSMAVLGLVVVVLLAAGGYLLMHKKAAAKTSGYTSSSSSKTSSNAPNNSAVLVTKSNSTVGQYLAEPNGTPLYTYLSDTSGVSNCTGTCLANWPAYQDTGATTGLPTGVGTIKRADNGQTQFTYNGMPLYTFVADTSGKVTGNGLDGFKIAKPAASSSSSSSGSSSSSSSSSSNSGYPY